MPKVETPKARRSRRQTTLPALGPVVLAPTVNGVKVEHTRSEIDLLIPAHTKPLIGPQHDPHPWKHRAELDFIEPRDWGDGQIITYLFENGFSIPGREGASPSSTPLFELSTCKGELITLPRGYRIPLMFVAKFQWQSLQLVITSPRRKEDWKAYKFDILHVSRLCAKFLEESRSVHAAGKMDKTWRCTTFDRALVRYYRRWLVSRDRFLRDFWLEFHEEEFATDILKRDWNTFSQRGHKGFCLTKAEIQNGITYERFTSGLDPICERLHSNSNPDSSVLEAQKIDSRLMAADDHSPLHTSSIQRLNDVMDIAGVVDPSGPPLSSPVVLSAPPSIQIKRKLMGVADVLRNTSGEITQITATPDSHPSAIADTDGGGEAAAQKTLAPCYPQERDHFSIPTACTGPVVQGPDEAISLIVEPIDLDIAAALPVPPISSTPVTLSRRNEGDHISYQGNLADRHEEIDILRAEDAIVVAEKENYTRMAQASEPASGVTVDIPPDDPATDCIVAKDDGRPGNANGTAATDVCMAEFRSTFLAQRQPIPESNARPPLDRLSTSESAAEWKSTAHASRMDPLSDQEIMNVHPMTTTTSSNSILSARSSIQPVKGRLEKNVHCVGVPTDRGMFMVRPPRNTISSPSISSPFGKSLVDRPRNNSWEARVKAAMERTLQRSKPIRTLTHRGLDVTQADADSILSGKRLSDCQVDKKLHPLERPVVEESQGSMLDRSPTDLESMDVDTNSTCVQYSGNPVRTGMAPQSRESFIGPKDNSLTGYSKTPVANHLMVNHTPVVKKLVSTLQNTLGGLTDVLETLEQEDARVSALLSSQLPIPYSSVSTSHAQSDASFVSGLLNEIQTLEKRIRNDAERIVEQDIYIQRLQNEINGLRCQGLRLNTQNPKAEPSSSSLQHLWDDLPSTSPHPLSHLLPQSLPILPYDSSEPPGSEHRCSPPPRTPSPSANTMYDGGSPLPIKSKRKHHMLFSDHQQN